MTRQWLAETPDEPIALHDPGKTEATEGATVQFEARDRWVDALTWEFGDGTTAEGWWVSHAYDATETYTVALTATDNTGNSTVHEVEITVEETDT